MILWIWYSRAAMARLPAHSDLAMSGLTFAAGVASSRGWSRWPCRWAWRPAAGPGPGQSRGHAVAGHDGDRAVGALVVQLRPAAGPHGGGDPHQPGAVLRHADGPGLRRRRRRAAGHGRRAGRRRRAPGPAHGAARCGRSACRPRRCDPLQPAATAATGNARCCSTTICRARRASARPAPGGRGRAARPAGARAGGWRRRRPRRPGGFFARLGLGRDVAAPPAPRGVYLHGGVGRGKSMLMDLFFAGSSRSPPSAASISTSSCSTCSGACICCGRTTGARTRWPSWRPRSPGAAAALLRRVPRRQHRRRHDPGPPVRGPVRARCGDGRDLELAARPSLRERTQSRPFPAVHRAPAQARSTSWRWTGRSTTGSSACATCRSTLTRWAPRPTRGWSVPSPPSVTAARSRPRDLAVGTRHLQVPRAACGVARFEFADLCEPRPRGRRLSGADRGLLHACSWRACRC